MDFAEPFRLLRAGLVSGRGHYERVIQAVLAAKQSVWIATANLKELMVEDARLVPGRSRTRPRYRSILEAFDEQAAAGVELRILHAAPPSRPFREQFDSLPRLVRGGVELRTCPRVHLKLVVVDASIAYLGSANFTGAGLGAKGEGRRNFELGIVSDDDETLDAVQALYERIWRGEECGRCRLREECEMPLDVVERAAKVASSAAAR